MKKSFLKRFLTTSMLVLLALPLVGKTEEVQANIGYVDPWGDNGDGTYTNPVLPSDYSDPDCIRVGDDYYLITSTFTSSPGLAVLHSKDLVNWETISHAIPDVSQLHPSYSWEHMGSNYGRAVYAPSIRYHDDMFYIYIPSFNAGGLFVATSESAEGPWEVTALKDMNGKPVDQLITDPCPFWDDDGNAYLIFSAVAARSDLDSGSAKGYPMIMCQMSEDGKQLLDLDASSNESMVATGTVVYNIQNTEASKIYKRNGYYYLFNCCFAGHSPNGPGSYMKRSKYLYGEHEDGTPGTPGNPGKYEIRFLGNDCPLQGGLVDTPDGKNWYWIAQFNDGGGGAAGGRQVHLVPVTWEDDWPIWGDNGAMVWTAEKPIQGQEVKSFQESDDFESEELSLNWQWNHEPRHDMYNLTENPGHLRLYAYKPLYTSDFFTAGNTIFQRYIRTNSVQATYKLDIDGMVDGQKAGMVHFNGGGEYYSLGVVQEGDRRYIQFDMDGNKTNGIDLELDETDIWFTTLTDENMTNQYYYSLDGEEYVQFGQSFNVWFSGYRGDQIGVYNYNDKKEDGYIDIDEFLYAYSGPAEKDVCRLKTNKVEVEGDWTEPVYLELLQADGYGKNTDITKKADFVVSDEDILEVDKNGKIIPKKAGSTLVTVLYESKGYLTRVSVAPETPPVTEENIVVYYKFDEEDTTVVEDHSGKGSDGIYVRNTTWTEGIDGGAVKLSGGGRGSSTANYVEIPNDFMADMKDITVNMWVNWDGGDVNQWLFAIGGNKTYGDNKTSMFLSPKNGSGRMYTAITDDMYNAEQGAGAATLEAGVWKMVTVTLNTSAKTLRMYVDGELVASRSDVTLSVADIYEQANDYAGYIGKSYYADDAYLGAAIDEFRIYDCPMTKQNVKSLYNSYVEEEIVLPYEDVKEGDWFYEAVYYNYIEKLMTGMDDTHFGPYGQLSRAQFALILYRMEGSPTVDTDKTFADITGNEWYGQAVLWAAEAGVVNGYTDGNFGPTDNITREQMALMMYRYADYLCDEPAASGDYSACTDAASVSGFAAEAMKWAFGNGIITGKENGTLIDPQGNTARCEAAAIIQRFME